MLVQPVTLTVGKLEMEGELFQPPARGDHPIVLIYHSALGLKPHEREIAERLTALGFAALAVDLYGAKDIKSEEDVGRYYMDVLENPDTLRERILAWYDQAATLPGVDASRMAAIGYCLGGMCVLELARSGRDAKACISFHGVLKTQSRAEPGDIKGEVVAWCGGQDPYAPMADVDTLREELLAAGAEHQITIFGQVPHGFSDRTMDGQGREGIGYHARADAVSWAGTVALLQDVLQ